MIKNVGLMLSQRAITSTHLEAFVEPSTGIRATYADLNNLSNQCAHILANLGLDKGAVL